MAEKKISGNTYRVDPLPAVESYALMGEMIKLSGPGSRFLPTILMNAIDVADEEEHETKERQLYMDVSALSAYSEMLDKYGAEAFAEFKKRVIEIAYIKRPSGVFEKVDIDGEFHDNLIDAEKLFNFVLEAQFGNFTKGAQVSNPLALSIILIKNIFQKMK